MEISIEKSRYNDKSRYYDGFSADYGLSYLRDFTVMHEKQLLNIVIPTSPQKKRDREDGKKLATNEFLSTGQHSCLRIHAQKVSLWGLASFITARDRGFGKSGDFLKADVPLKVTFTVRRKKELKQRLLTRVNSRLFQSK